MNNPLKAYALLTLTQLFWAGNWIAGRAARDDVPPITLGFWRWVIAWLLFLPLAWPHLRASWPILRAHWRPLVLLGALGTGLYNTCTYIGLSNTTVTNGVLINAFCPIVIIAMGWAFMGRRLSRLQTLGVLVSLVGVLFILAQGDLRVILQLKLNRGDLWVLLSVVSWSAYTCLLSKRPPALNNWVFLVAISGVGLVLMAPFYFWEIASGKLIHPVPTSFVAIAYTGIFPAFMGYLFWNWGVSQIGPSRAGLFMHLMPAFGIVLSMIFLGERLADYHLAGIAMILTGIALTTRERRLAPP